MNSVVNGFYSSSGNFTSHFFTISIAVNRLVRWTHASNSLKAWYSIRAVHFADLHALCMGRGTKGQPLSPFSSSCLVSLWGCFSTDPLHLDSPFPDPRVRTWLLLLSDNPISTQETLSEGSLDWITRIHVAGRTQGHDGSTRALLSFSQETTEFQIWIINVRVPIQVSAYEPIDFSPNEFRATISRKINIDSGNFFGKSEGYNPLRRPRIVQEGNRPYIRKV